MIKKDTEVYTDKAVTEIELPKMIVCLKEGSYLVVKDICIDEGVYSFVDIAEEDKKVCNVRDEGTNETHASDGLKMLNSNAQPIFYVDKEDTTQHSFGSFLGKGGDKFDTMDGSVSNVSDGKSVTENFILLQEFDRGQCQGHVIDVAKEGAKQHSFCSLLEEGGVKFDTVYEIVDNASDEESITEKLCPLQELDRGHCQVDLSNFDCKCDQTQSVNGNSNRPQSGGGNSDQPLSVNDSSNVEQSDEGALEETNTTTSSLSSALKEPKGSDRGMDFSSNGKTENNIIAFDIDSEPPAISARKESKGTTEFLQSGQDIGGTGLEDASNDASIASARSSFAHLGHADSSFSGPASLSGPIAHLGQIPYSGSISLRSDSSTTSTRSFAFPILQSEWNSSPERMAKADRGHFRKHRGWRSGLFCCGF